MFSFFRKSKKETESHGSSKKHNKDNGISNALPDARIHKEMCKNNITIENVESAPQCANNVSVVSNVATDVASSSALLTNSVEQTENASSVLSGSENETKTINNNDPTTMSVSSKAQVYANMLRTIDSSPPPRESKGGVKPCGHGTVAIAPKIPLAINRRENPISPPDSPKAEYRNKLPLFYKSPNEFGKNEMLHNRNNNSAPKYELVNTQPMNDTVTGVMKLRVDIPPVNPTTTTPPPVGVDSEKYVIILLCLSAILKTIDVTRF